MPIVPLIVVLNFAAALLPGAARAGECDLPTDHNALHAVKGQPIEGGKASYYARSLHGLLTANGETHDSLAMVAAHRTLPFGTLVKVTNLRNRRVALVRVNDRGPMVVDRVIDVSRAAAELLGFVHNGIVRVRLEILDRADSEASALLANCRP